jgi:hypothetical protein
MIVNPKESVMAILGPILGSQISPRSNQELVRRIGIVSQILKNHPELKNDREVYGCLLSATKNSVDEKIFQFRRSLIVDQCLPIDNKTGILVVTKDEINQLTTDEFWAYIKKQCIKSLVISLESESVIYDRGFLKRLLQNKPQIEDLSEMYTLQFDEEIISITKAKLRLCGMYFETALNIGMTETANKNFQFQNILIKEHRSESQEPPSKVAARVLPANIFYKGFQEILHAIEMDEYDFSKSSEEFNITAEYFQFYAEFEFPEGIFGKEVLEKHLGDVGEVPLPPKELIEAMEAPCPFSNDANLKTKDTHIITWVPLKIGNDKLSPNRLEALINSDKSGPNKIGFKPGWAKFPGALADHEAEGGYWLMMLKNPLEVEDNLNDGVEDMTYEDAERRVNNYENYGIPTLIDAMLCVLLNYVCSAEKKERILSVYNLVNVTWCQENGRCKKGVWHMAVGPLAPWGLFVDFKTVSTLHVGVCPVRKFCATL